VRAAKPTPARTIVKKTTSDRSSCQEVVPAWLARRASPLPCLG
jgi:hypothetical protein